MSKELGEQQISAGGRWLCDQSADACGVNRDDNWKVYGNEYIEEFRGAYNAAVSVEPAAANKAAEEDGLPDFKIYSVISKAGWDVDDNYKDELYKLCKAAIAADRASRQVANKADWRVESYLDAALFHLKNGKYKDAKGCVEDARKYYLDNKAEVDTQMLDFLGSSAVVSVHQYEPREGAAYIAIDLDAPGSPTVRGANIREAIDKAMGIATPPATTGGANASHTGASTSSAGFALRSRVADLLHLLEFAEISTPSEGDAEQAKKAMRDVRRMLNEDPFGSKSVGASTVLTDEREPFAYVRFRSAQRLTTEGGADAYEWYEFCKAHEIGDDKLPAFPVYDQPVAAQAGQVAVPAWISVDERLPECDMRPDSLGVEVIVYPKPEKGESTAFFGCRITAQPDFYKYGNRIGGVTHWMPLPAAPSPAKESK